MTTPLDRAPNRRSFTRVRFAHPVTWQSESGQTGPALVHDVSRAGLCLSLGKGCWPGSVVRLRFEDLHHNGAAIALPVRTAWCRASADGEGFVAGLSVIHETPSTLTAVSEVFYEALQRLGQRYGLRAAAAPQPLNSQV